MLLFARGKRLDVCFVVFLFLLMTVYAKGYAQDKDDINKLYKKAKSLSDEKPDSVYSILENYTEYFARNKDTSRWIDGILVMADIKKNKGDFGKAYDHSWEALLLSEEFRDTLKIADCHQLIGMMYGIFNNHDLTIQHMKKSLELRKAWAHNNSYRRANISKPYFSMAVQYVKSKRYDLANTYLDSCLYITQKFHNNTGFIQVERAYIAIKQDDLDRAETILKEITPYFIENNLSFMVMIYSYWGELYQKQNKSIEALLSYKACLETMAATNKHTDIRPKVLEEMSAIYIQKGENEKAIYFLLESKALNDSLFSARNNNKLLEVKNTYRQAIQLKNKELAEQDVLLDKRRDANFRLKVIIGMILLVLVIALLVIKQRFERKKYLQSKKELELKAKLEMEKMDEVMEAKNKEITSYTLQLIDKERSVDNLLEQLKKNMDDKTFRGIRNSVKDTNKNLWDEFNARFSQVNTSFYEKLLIQFPVLTPTDLKHCALIKLNFNGNEMAQLLNISLPSVHIARHRLRKKLGLKREDNLAVFISHL
ncbi:tetratricopeptide repeat protein [Labilibacter marinus]|uniref:tetratricopeptide repeat protein n=1 Tax=Labilibacter marinus TaxID=1477105 RepID=UPI00094FAFA6|nr:hypothetical protein [Labilibacter marinus]